MARARGLALAHLASHPDLQGPAREALLATVEDETRALVEAGVEPEAWYPESLHLDLYRAIVKTLALDEAATIAFFTAAQHDALSMSRRNFHRLETTLAQLPVRWRRGHDTGHLRVQRREVGGVTVMLDDHPYAHEPIYRAVVLSGVAALLADIRVIQSATHESAGHDQARMRLTWTRAPQSR